MWLKKTHPSWFLPRVFFFLLAVPLVLLPLILIQSPPSWLGDLLITSERATTSNFSFFTIGKERERKEIQEERKRDCDYVRVLYAGYEAIDFSNHDTDINDSRTKWRFRSTGRAGGTIDTRERKKRKKLFEKTRTHFRNKTDPAAQFSCEQNLVQGDRKMWHGQREGNFSFFLSSNDARERKRDFFLA